MDILFDQGPGPGLEHFSAPARLLEAWTQEAVDDALAALDAAHRAGYWLAGYATYELAYALEPRLQALMPGERAFPLLRFGVYDAPCAAPPATVQEPVALGPLAPQWAQGRYGQAFAAIQAALAAGEIYQANLTFPLKGPCTGTPQALYAALKARQAVPYGALVVQEGAPAILCRSPELFFRTDGAGRIETRPMKGTQPRYEDRKRDRAARAFLQSDEKNRAENLMIVDLLRNDLGRLCQLGSVAVPELFALESFETVHQMTSTVTGQLEPEVTLGDLLRALFPCGSITGAPKLQAMKTLASLEDRARGIYCGTLGWFAPDGRSEFNVAIRTLALDSDRAHLSVGGGIVFDSCAELEYEEALWKARFADLSPKAAN